ncbi:Rv3235 family protein [Nocardia aurantia]|uniref:Rv3235 family protein n=1 Tax=Nocardia aurantia TaxID=2585199 RepID=UPI0012955E4D|nr:Rv3235 family protein [Nocardia aurantia]
MAVLEGCIPAEAGSRDPEVPERPPLPNRDGRGTACVGTEVDVVRRFAGRAVRVVLEVVDGRRPVAQLTLLADPTVVAAVATVVRLGAVERRLGPAVLVTLEVAVSGPRAAEIFGSYERGGRRFALAARVLHGRQGWRLAALRLR